jgi:hypothetical protein
MATISITLLTGWQSSLLKKGSKMKFQKTENGGYRSSDERFFVKQVRVSSNVGGKAWGINGGRNKVSLWIAHDSITNTKADFCTMKECRKWAEKR